MSVSENAAMQAVKDLDPAVRKYLGDGNPLLSGPCTVSVSIGFENPVTPELAATMAMMEFARSGFDIFTFEVLDENSGDTFYVRHGQTYTKAELEAELEDLREQREEQEQVGEPS